MSQKANIYENGKIYKIINDATDKIYIGSTIQPLSKRLSQHKHKKSCCSRELLELGNCKIILIENFKCDNKEQLTAREQYWIDNSSNCINKNMKANVLIKYKDNPKEYMKQKRKNSEKRIAYRKEYYQKMKQNKLSQKNI